MIGRVGESAQVSVHGEGVVIAASLNWSRRGSGSFLFTFLFK